MNTEVCKLYNIFQVNRWNINDKIYPKEQTQNREENNLYKNGFMMIESRKTCFSFVQICFSKKGTCSARIYV